MSRQLVTRPTPEGDMYTLFASIQPNLNAFRTYMKRKGIRVRSAGQSPVYGADYDAVGQRLRAGYMSPGINTTRVKGREIKTNVGAMLIVSGLEQKLVEAEAQSILDAVGESEDMKTLNYFVLIEARMS